MRLLLDAHILLAFARHELSAIDGEARAAIAEPRNTSLVSAASLWEIAIKTRIGKLDPVRPLEDLAAYFQAIGFVHLAVDHRHAIVAVDPLPATRDPFDRLLLAQCAVEGLRLITIDRVLRDHPLAWRAG